WVKVDAFPLTANGKVNRAALPAPTPARQSVTHDDRPWTDIEKALGDIWRNVLRHDDISLTESFFELGGNSLLAVKALSQASAQFSLHIPTSIMYESPTIAGLARSLQRQLTGTRNGSVVQLREGSGQCSPLFL